MIPVIGSYFDVKCEELPKEKGEKVCVRWLLERGKNAENFSMRLFEISPGGEIGRHAHPWEHGIFVIDGEGELEVNGRSFTVEGGSYIYIPRGAFHSYRNRGKGSFKFLCIIPKGRGD